MKQDLILPHDPLRLGDPSLKQTKGGNTVVAKFSWPIASSDNETSVEADLMRDCAGMFGTQRLHYASLMHNTNNRPLTNHLLLPVSAQEAQNEHWPLFVKTGDVPQPEYRSLFGYFVSLLGHSLVKAPTPTSMFQAIGHAMLGMSL